MSARRVRVFVSYAHADRTVVEALLDHLGWLENSERIEIFDDRKLIAGEEWDQQLRDELARAQLVLFVVTAKFLRSRYCTKTELTETIRRREAEGTRVIPILAETCAWSAMPLAKLQALPKDANLQLKPLNKWGTDIDVALTQIVEQVTKIVDELAEAASDHATMPATAAGEPAPDLRRPEPAPSWRRPNPPDRCLGRSGPTGRIIEALLHDPPDPVVLYGPAGIGKSTLARAVACHPQVVDRFGDRRAFVALDKAMDADGVLTAVRAAVALPPSTDGWDDLEPLLEEDLILIVLDDLEVPWERAEHTVEGTISRLAMIHTVLLIGAIRGRHPALPPPGWKLAEELLPLASPDARELLLTHAPLAADEPEILDKALKELDGVPLAIQLFAARVTSQRSLGTAWDEWTRQRRRRGDQPAEPKSPLAISLDFALASPRIDESARRLYAALGRLPLGWAADRVDQLLRQPVGDAAQQLVQASLVYQRPGRLAMLGPVRDHALAQPLPADDEKHLTDCLLTLADALPLHQEVPADPLLSARARDELDNIEAELERLRPQAAADRHKLGWRWMQVGDTYLGRGDLPAALRAYQFAGQHFRGCVQQERSQPRWQRSTAVGLLRQGDVQRDLGDVDKARRAYRSAADMLAIVADLEPGQRQWRRDLAVARSSLADLLLAQADVAGAAVVQTSALDVLQALARAEPGDATIQRDLLVAWAKVGQLRLRQQDPAAALSAHAAAAEIAAALAAREPHNLEWQRDLSVARLGAGDAHRESGDLTAALSAYTDGLAIRDRLAAAAPDDLRHQRDLAVALERVAVTRQALGDSKGALQAWRQALAISQGLAAARPDNTGLGLARVTHLHGIANALDLTEAAAREEAVTLLRHAVDILRAAAAAGRLDAERRTWIGTLEARLAALTDTGAVVTAPPPSQQAG